MLYSREPSALKPIGVFDSSPSCGVRLVELTRLDVQQEDELIGVPADIGDGGLAAVRMPGAGVELASFPVEHEPVPAGRDVQQVDGHIGRPLLIGVEEHPAPVVGDRPDLVLDVLTLGDRARPADASWREDVELPLLGAKVVELEHDAARGPAVVSNGILVAAGQLAGDAPIDRRCPEVEKARAVVHVADLTAVGREGEIVEEVGAPEGEELLEARGRGCPRGHAIPA